MKEKIKNFLITNKIEFKEIDSRTMAVNCPFCEITWTNGDKPTNFYINQETGKSECWDCKALKEFFEYAQRLNIPWDNKIEIKAETSISNYAIKKEIKLWSVSEIMKHDFGEQNWLVKDLLPIETITLLSGNPQNYKTWITIELARCVALGTPFLNHFQTMQGAVLIVNEEDHLRYIKNRFEVLQVAKNAPIYYLSQEGIKIDKEESLKTLLSIVKERDIKLVIFDSFIRVHSLKENEAGDMAYFFDKIRELIKMGASVLITHHHRKELGYGPKDHSQSIRGSSDISAAVDSHLSVEKKNEEVIVYQNKLRVAESLKPFKITISHDEFRKNITLLYNGELPEQELKKDKVKTIILEILKDSEYSREELNTKILASINTGKNSILVALKDLETEKLIRTRKEAKNKRFYSLPPE